MVEQGGSNPCWVNLEQGHPKLQAVVLPCYCKSCLLAEELVPCWTLPENRKDEHKHLTRIKCLPLQELKERHREVMQEMLMDVLRALSAPNMDIRKKTLDIALDLITARNIDEVGSHPLTDLLLQERVGRIGGLQGSPQALAQCHQCMPTK